jgi:hypothetical protein
MFKGYGKHTMTFKIGTKGYDIHEDGDIAWIERAE